MNGCHNGRAARHRRGRMDGGALPLTALVLPALLAALAVSIVFGQLFVARHEIWQAADLAVLAATRQVSEESLWLGRPSLDAEAAYRAAWHALRDNGLEPGAGGVTATFAVAEGRVIRARKAAPEVTLTVCRPVTVLFPLLVGQRAPVNVCATARAAVLRPKRPLPR